MYIAIVFHAASREFCQRGSNNDHVFISFLVNEGRIQIPLKVGQHWPASKTPF